MRKRIVCFGDSNTWGLDVENETRFPERIRWTGRLAELLGNDYSVIEEGLSGRTSVMDDPLNEGLNGFHYIYPCLKSHAPLKLVVIMLGTNDTKERFHLTAANIARGISRVALKAKNTPTGINQQQPEVLVVAPPAIGAGYATTKVAETMGRECAEKSVAFPDILENLLENEGISYLNSSHIPMNEIDYMHLDETGHTLLAKLVFDEITKQFL